MAGGFFSYILLVDKIAVVDFGSQYAHLIANRLRRLGVYSEIVLPETSSEKLAKYKGLILSGGPNSVYEKGAPTISPRIFSLGIPILGMCYGHQLITHILGGKVEPGKTKEYGLAKLSVLKRSEFLKESAKIPKFGCLTEMRFPLYQRVLLLLGKRKIVICGNCGYI